MSDERAGTSPGAPEPPGMPGWVKGLGIALIALVVAVVLFMLLSGGQHGPGMHG
jgi:hypothetical protein